MKNNHHDDEWDRYAAYEEEFDPMRTDRQARRKRKPRVDPNQAKRDYREIIEEIADAAGLEAGFETTYQPGLFEEEWLLSSLRPFYDQALITDVLGRVKGGKEASVYRCAGHESTGQALVAAKVYRPRKFRNLRNDRMYREGRDVIGLNGKAITERDRRAMRALSRGSSLGQQMQHTSWLMYEYRMLQTLYQAGGAVPQPFGSSENAILMGYCGDDRRGAPTLHEVDLDPGELEPLFTEIMRNVALMLHHGFVHGDLSAYNVLYWDGTITLVDFPQVVDLHANSRARGILERDITRVCEYFAFRGLTRDPQAIVADLWQRYGPEPPLPFVPEELEPEEDGTREDE